MYLLLLQEYKSFTAPHRLKAIASGKCIVMLPLILFTDDTSGNKSKQWNKFDSWCLKLAGLPEKEKSKLHNIHLMTCSNKCSVLEMAQPLVDNLLRLELDGVVSYDVSLDMEVLVIAPVLCVLGDNPRHSEIMSHSGSSAKMFCRMCMVGDSVTCASLNIVLQAEKEKSGDKILQPRSREQTLQFIQRMNAMTTEKAKALYKVQCGINTSVNPLLKLPVDLHR